MPVIDPALLRAFRERAGLRRETTAEALGSSYASIQSYERGVSTPPGDTLIRLARLYGCQVEDFCAADPAAVPVAARPIRLTAPLSCPSCGQEFTGRWTAPQDTADQRCPACADVFTATWPGFTFEPERVVVRAPGQEPSRGAA